MSTKVRYQLYLDAGLSEQMETLASKNGHCKSAILTDALRAYLNRRGAKELDDLLGVRLSRLEHDQQVMLESFALFVRYYLTVTAPVNEQDKAALAIGQDRFQLFIRQVARRLAGGKGLSHDSLLRTVMEAAE
ncbi:MAG: CopG family transcriptional regulator [Rhodospirillaceae bacterium]